MLTLKTVIDGVNYVRVRVILLDNSLISYIKVIVTAVFICSAVSLHVPRD